MNNWDTEQLVVDDTRCVWHPFTSMGDWCVPEHVISMPQLKNALNTLKQLVQSVITSQSHQVETASAAW